MESLRHLGTCLGKDAARLVGVDNVSVVEQPGRIVLGEALVIGDRFLPS